MKQLLLVIQREYVNKVRNKSFIIMTFLSPLIFIGLIALVVFLTQLNNDKTKVITVVDQSGLFTDTFTTIDHYQFQYVNNTLDRAKAAVNEKEEFGLLYIPNKPVEELPNAISFYSSDSPSMSLINDISAVLEKEIFNKTLENKGVDVQELNNSKKDVRIALEDFSGEHSSKVGGVLKLVFGGAAGYLLMMFIIIYGNMIMRSVIEEKTNRIIEIIISSIKPRKLMMGKILGTSLAGVTQFFMWLIIGVLLVTAISMVFHVDMSEMQTPQQQMLAQQGVEKSQLMVQEGMAAFFEMPIATLVLCFLIYFIGGYLLYSSLYAAIGAAVDSETDTQQFMLPIIMPLMLSIYVGFFTVMDDPHGTVATIFSFIPFTSPIVMLMRIPFGVDVWQIVLSIAILYATFMGVVWLAAKIYRVGILMYGKKPTYKELYKWLKY